QRKAERRRSLICLICVNVGHERTLNNESGSRKLKSAK
ncbi:MAG: hypothetical protein ACI9WU_004519, partial [Myxococcota bacterium]